MTVYKETSVRCETQTKTFCVIAGALDFKKQRWTETWIISHYIYLPKGFKFWWHFFKISQFQKFHSHL